MAVDLIPSSDLANAVLVLVADDRTPPSTLAKAVLVFVAPALIARSNWRPLQPVTRAVVSAVRTSAVRVNDNDRLLVTRPWRFSRPSQATDHDVPEAPDHENLSAGS